MKRVLSLFLAVILAGCLGGVSVYAQTYSDKAIIAVSKKNVTVGSVVTVTVSQTSSYPMAAIQGSLQYNNSILQFVSGESGSTANKGSTVKIVKDSAPTNSISVSVKFKAIAAGSGSLSYSGNSFSDNDDGHAAAGTAIVVKEVKPSSNNNLGSLKISAGKLSPAFRANRLNYTATVKYDVTNITISANASAGDSKVAGVGTFDLNVGNNTRGVTVTAASGDKKTYTIKIKRMSEEETAEEEIAEREKNPLFFECNGTYCFIVPSLSDMPEYEGYEKDVFENKDQKIEYFKDKAGKYNLVWATDEKGENGAFYNREANGEYTKINYLLVNEHLYVVEHFEDGINVSSQFILSEQEVNGDNIECYRYSDEQMENFCVLYCYQNGQSDYYRFDSVENTIQREPMFLSAAKEAGAVAEAEDEGIINIFKNLGTQAKIIILLLCFSGLLILALIILIIAKAASGRKKEFKEDDEQYDVIEDTDNVLDEDETQEPALDLDKEDNINQPVENEAPVGETYHLADEEKSDGLNADTSEFIDMNDDF